MYRSKDPLVVVEELTLDLVVLLVVLLLKLVVERHVGKVGGVAPAGSRPCRRK